MFLEISRNSQEKETQAQVFSCEFREISKNTFFTEHLWATASISASKLIYLLDYIKISQKFIHTAQKINFSFKDFFSKCDQIRRKTADMVTFTEEILNGKLHFLCSVRALQTYTMDHFPKIITNVSLKP